MPPDEIGWDPEEDIPSDTPGWTEKATSINYIGPADPWPVQDAGSAAIYYCDIYDAEGTVIGHSVGYTEAIEIRASDGHVIVMYHEAVELPEGTFKAVGTVDQNAIPEGKWIHLEMKGTSGKFLGASGSRSYQAIPPLEQRKAHVRMIFGQ
jgi:Allene oxide cyclase barrel like domain